MWRRAVSSHLKTVAAAAAAACPSASRTSPLRFKSYIYPSVSACILSRYFASESADTSVKMSVEDINPIATGHEREELEAELQGRKILEDVNNPVGPFGTKVCSFHNQTFVKFGQLSSYI
ncbi:hypothetical protein SLEP1_g43853 [Rubroshorea leprosula]|uniref:Uncharacterized protein n=1 Tax=Rubroshorea leprosula TaxID=152421 RepID=A0AAV5LG17_9ROSI|nr:hypothetical protein SLEP1_g43853 [Rubroshorea leprosula]